MANKSELLNIFITVMNRDWNIILFNLILCYISIYIYMLSIIKMIKKIDIIITEVFFPFNIVILLIWRV